MKHKLIIAYKGGNEEKKQAVLIQYICAILLKDVLEVQVTPYNDSKYDIYLFKEENKISIIFKNANTTLDFPPKNIDIFLNNVKHMTQAKTFTYNDNYDKKKLVTLLFPIGLYLQKQFHTVQSKNILLFPNTQSIHTFFRVTPNPVQTLSKSKSIIFFYKTTDNDNEKEMRLKIYSWIDFLAYTEDIDSEKFYFYSDSDMSLPWALLTLGSRGVTAQRHESNNFEQIVCEISKENQIREREYKPEKDIDFSKDEYTKEINIKPSFVPKNTLNEFKVALENEIRKKLFDTDKGEIIKFNKHTFVKKYDVNVLNNFKEITELGTEAPEDILFSYIEVNDIDRLMLYLKGILGEGQDKF